MEMCRTDRQFRHEGRHRRIDSSYIEGEHRMIDSSYIGGETQEQDGNVPH